MCSNNATQLWSVFKFKEMPSTSILVLNPFLFLSKNYFQIAKWSIVPETLKVFTLYTRWTNEGQHLQHESWTDVIISHENSFTIWNVISVYTFSPPPIELKGYNHTQNVLSLCVGCLLRLNIKLKQKQKQQRKKKIFWTSFFNTTSFCPFTKFWRLCATL